MTLGTLYNYSYSNSSYKDYKIYNKIITEELIYMISNGSFKRKSFPLICSYSRFVKNDGVNDYQNLGLEVIITELDVRINDDQTGKTE